jgi:LytS/YehU family sensor histidine kinase
MMTDLKSRTVNAVLSKPVYQFWLWQVSYWLFVSFIGFFTLTLWYGELRWPFIFHTFAQAALGLLSSLFLYAVFMRIWFKPISARFVIGIVMVLVVALLWTLARLALFISIIDDPSLWSDFGGWYYASIFIFLCWTGMFHGVRYYQLLQSEHETMLKAAADARKEQMQRIQAQSVARDAQIKMLRYQLTPHFLCNTLNAISSLVEVEESKKAQEMTVQLSRFLRHSLDNNPDTKISLQAELKALNLYLSIEKSRFEDRLDVEFDVDDMAQYAAIPSLLLQPIIENSMKHAISQNEEGGIIAVKAYVLDQRLSLELSDTGPGQDALVNKGDSAGIGLRNTSERLKVLYNEQYTYETELLPSGGLKTAITIPYEKIGDPSL